MGISWGVRRRVRRIFYAVSVKYLTGNGLLSLFDRVRDNNKGYPSFSKKVPLSRAVDRGSPPSMSLGACGDYANKNSVCFEKDSFVLYRIIGNDLPPRHRSGQTRKNLAFLLENEPNFPNCEKRFVVNRIINADEEVAVLKLLQNAGVPFIHIPFDRDAYRLIGWDILGVPVDYSPCSPRFDWLSEDRKARVLMRLYRYKNNYVMNNNGARNAALREGRQLAKWVLPWDGNCFITETAWKEITRAVHNAPDLPYFIVPMARITDNSRLLEEGFRPEATEEPQILFRSDSALEFDEEFFYGRRPKVEFLWRLGVPGPWDQWGIEPWDLPCPSYANEAGAYGQAGWVARLFSGQAHMEVGVANIVSGNRVTARMQAIQTMLDELDERVSLPVDLAQPCFLSIDEAANTLPGELSEKLREEANEALTRGPYSVIHKTSLPPSRSRHDYWHPAPYYWPHPLRLFGFPHIHRDGRRAPGTRLYEPRSNRYDRTRLQRLFDDTFILSIAWRHYGESRYGEHAALLVRTWFVDPETAMSPHLEYAQVRPGHNGNRGSSSGIIEMKNLYYFLDGVRLLQNAGFISDGDQCQLKKWFSHYLNWLCASDQGREARRAVNNQGTYYDLQVASIAAFLGNRRILRETFRDSRSRLLMQFDAEGRQPEELIRATSAHYCLFNLQGWINLALLAEFCGEDLWSFRGHDGRGLCRAMEWVLSSSDQGWPYPQIDAIDNERFIPILHAACSRYGMSINSHVDKLPRIDGVKPIFSPYDGIMPFWQLAAWSRIAV